MKLKRSPSIVSNSGSQVAKGRKVTFKNIMNDSSLKSILLKSIINTSGMFTQRLNSVITIRKQMVCDNFAFIYLNKF